MITFGAIAGIAAGNIAHYGKYFILIHPSIFLLFILAYFPPYNTTNITNTSNDTFGNGTSYQGYIPRQSLRLWLPSNKQLENADTSRK